jgi:hypothetical protein
MTVFKMPEQLLRELGMTRPEHLDLEVIAWHCGATVVYEPLAGCEASIIGRDHRAIITVSAASPRARQRFSIGHELGHWMRDRGIIGAACDKSKMSPQRRADGPEHLANVYAADLLLPGAMFVPRAQGRPITFETVRNLAGDFGASLTATAIRLVQRGSFPSIILYTDASGRRWAVRGDSIPDRLQLHREPGIGTLAHDLSHGRDASSPMDIRSDQWFDHPQADRYSVREDSLRVGAGVLTLLWWKDERQLIDLDDDE